MKTSVWRLSVVLCVLEVMAFSVIATRSFARSCLSHRSSAAAFVTSSVSRQRLVTASTQKSSSRNLSRLSRLSPEEGDAVQVIVDGELVSGTVKERRGAGWYSVQVPVNGGSNTTIKCRGSSIKLVTDTNEPMNETQANSRKQQTPPTIVDLDASIQSLAQAEGRTDQLFLEQCAHHATYQKWIMFSDLHVSPSSLETCLEVLDTVHTLASERQAGVLFLGDWWHHRGTIRVDCLNAVLEALRSWTVPLVLIPGNHDQVTLGLSRNHGLTPLEHSFRVEHTSQEGVLQSVSGPLVFSHATKFCNALFVPHIRDVSTMEAVLNSKESRACQALFVHADVTGASMNDLIVSRGGISPSKFPPNKTIYSGHFHKPHTVTRGGVKIEYIGSPYETSLAEAGQQKSLLVLDAEKNWTCIERIPMSIGRRHFRIASVSDLLELNVSGSNDVKDAANSIAVARKGDRVVFSVQKEDTDEMRRKGDPQIIEFDDHIQALRKEGVAVEVREIKSIPMGPMGDGDSVGHALEEMAPQATITSYFESEVSREAMQNTTAGPLLRAALAVLDELKSNDESMFSATRTATDTELSLESVTLQGFGPFHDEVTYPLKNRGLVLLRGANKDGGSDSNGSGKSSLAMAALWALTGSTDPSPLQDSKVSDVVNDHCKTARVSVQGTLNGEYFAITRTKASRKGLLSFQLGGRDLTTQSAKDTQRIIDEKLGDSQILARTIFHGQHAMNGLLEASDARLKEELSVVVPLELWQEAASLARSKSRAASKKAAELSGMVTMRSNDVQELKSRLEEAKDSVRTKQAAYDDAKRQVQQQIDTSYTSDDDSKYTFGELQRALNQTNLKVEELESRLLIMTTERDTKLLSLEDNLGEISVLAAKTRDERHLNQRETDTAELRLETEKEKLASLASKWDIDLSGDGATSVFVAPGICPTCQQPITMSRDGHSHEDLKNSVELEIAGATRAVADAQDTLEKQMAALQAADASYSEHENARIDAQSQLESAAIDWQQRIAHVGNELLRARQLQLEKSSQFADAANQIQQTAEIQALNSSLAAELERLQRAESVYEGICDDVTKAETNIATLTRESVDQQNACGLMSDLADIFGPRGVQTFVLQNAISALQVTTQAYLDELSDGAQRLELELDSGDRISRRAFVGGSDGTLSERSLSSLSGGQWRRCSLAMSLGFVDLMARRGRMRPSLCVLDEPLTHLDRNGRAQVGKVLRSILRRKVDNVGALEATGMTASTILIILQDLAAEELEESFDLMDEVVKEHGKSTVVIDEQQRL